MAATISYPLKWTIFIRIVIFSIQSKIKNENCMSIVNGTCNITSLPLFRWFHSIKFWRLALHRQCYHHHHLSRRSINDFSILLLFLCQNERQQQQHLKVFGSFFFSSPLSILLNWHFQVFLYDRSVVFVLFFSVVAVFPSIQCTFIY